MKAVKADLVKFKGKWYVTLDGVTDMNESFWKLCHAYTKALTNLALGSDPTSWKLTVEGKPLSGGKWDRTASSKVKKEG